MSSGLKRVPKLWYVIHGRNDNGKKADAVLSARYFFIISYLFFVVPRCSHLFFVPDLDAAEIFPLFYPHFSRFLLFFREDRQPGVPHSFRL